jgi:hypothetical protein
VFEGLLFPDQQFRSVLVGTNSPRRGVPEFCRIDELTERYVGITGAFVSPSGMLDQRTVG